MIEYIKKSDILEELGDINMDIYTDEVKEMINELPAVSIRDFKDLEERHEYNMDFLLTQCKDVPELYNRVAGLIFSRFGLASAEVCLMCTWVAKTVNKR